MIGPERIPSALAAISMFTLATWVLWLGPSRRLHRALALLVFLRALPLFVLSFDDRAASAAGQFVAYLLIAIPFAALNFAYAFRAEHGPVSRWSSRPFVTRARWSILGAAVMVEMLYLVRHDLWGTTAADGAFTPGWFFLAAPFSYLTFAAVALAMTRALGHMPLGEGRRAVGLVALAFAVEPLYRATFHVASASRVAEWTAMAAVEHVIWGLTVLVGLVAIGSIWWQSGGAGGGRYATLAGILAGGSLVSGMAVRAAFWAAVPTRIEDALLLLWTLDALWFIVFVVLAVYATVMHHLFDIDLKAKALLNGGTFAAGLGFVLVVIGESLERIIPISEPVLAILLAVTITLLLRPAHRLAHRIADVAFPGVQRTDDYVHRRRAQLYRAALEGAYRDGAVTEKERAVLETLRDEVGLDPKAAERLERTVRAQWTRAGAPVAGLPPQDGGFPKPP